LDGHSDRRRALEAAFTGHLAKPVDLERIERLVETGAFFDARTH
jgi:hypothetical protein